MRKMISIVALLGAALLLALPSLQAQEACPAGKTREGCALDAVDDSGCCPVEAAPQQAQGAARLSVEMVRIEAGTFFTGFPVNERQGSQEEVRIDRPFYLMKYEVTQGEFEEVMGWNPTAQEKDFRLPFLRSPSLPSRVLGLQA